MSLNKDVARRRSVYRYVVYAVLCCGLTIQVFYTVATGCVKEHDSHRSRDLLQVDHPESEDYYPSETDEVWIQSDFMYVWNHHVYTNSSKCTKPDITDFPCGVFTEKQRRNGAIVVHLLVAMYMCIAVAIACDYYFVPSMEVICYKLNIQEDVGGATLMAFGSSTPDFCAVIIGILLTEGDIGVGTIVGASMFNLLFVIGLCGIFATTELKLSWWPVVRDTTWFCISLVAVSVVMLDSIVHWAEALIMIMMYIIYIIIMWQNRRIEKGVYLLIGDPVSLQARFEDSVMKCSLLSAKNEDTDKDSEVSETSVDSSIDYDMYDYCGYPTDPPVNIFQCPDSGCFDVMSWIITLPIKFAFFLTIPDLRRPRCHPFVGVTFIVGITWIGVLSYVLLWMITVIGFTINIPDSVMGITFVCFGSSIADAMASVFVSKRGKGDMAVSQAIASNTLGILVGLGVPWLIKSAMSDGKGITIESGGMIISSFVTFAVALIVLLTFSVRKFVLDRTMGVTLLIAYVIYVVLSVIMEMSLYASYRLPLCAVKS